MSGNDTETPSGATPLSSEVFIEKLTKALRRDGDFPASAKVVAELRDIASKPETTANQVTEIILREPSLGMRVLHIANSTFYRRAKPIMTVSQAVVQIGMRPLTELCSGLVLLQKFVPAARSGGVFAECLQKTITTSILTSSINRALHTGVGKSNLQETGYLAGTFFEMGALLMAFYFPTMYEAATKRAESKSIPLRQAIKDLTGLSPAEISVAVLSALHLPHSYGNVIANAETGQPKSSSQAPSLDSDTSALLTPLFAAQTLSTAIVSQGGSETALQDALREISSQTNMPITAVQSALATLESEIREHGGPLEIEFPPLPAAVQTFIAQASGIEVSQEADKESQSDAEPEDQSDFNRFVDEIRSAVANREPTASVITSVMETLAFCMHFERVILLLAAQGKSTLRGRMGLGSLEAVNVQNIARSLGSDANPSAPDAQAFQQSRPIFQGDPIFDDGWPFAALPIGFGDNSIGVIYCDRTDPDGGELTRQEQASIGVLCELLDRSVTRKAS